MAKKLNLKLREPVRLHTTERVAPVLPAPFDEPRGLEEELDKGETTETARLREETKSVSVKNARTSLDFEKENEKSFESKASEPRREAPQTTATENQKDASSLKTKANADEKIASKLQADARAKMSPRTLQIWNYLCALAKSGDEAQRSLSVTRSQVMRAAGIGSTNTYRDALQKFQELGLIEIELRPGVNAGSVFHFTKDGWRQVEIND